MIQEEIEAKNKLNKTLKEDLHSLENEKLEMSNELETSYTKITNLEIEVSNLKNYIEELTLENKELQKKANELKDINSKSIEQKNLLNELNNQILIRDGELLTNLDKIKLLEKKEERLNLLLDDKNKELERLMQFEKEYNLLIEEKKLFRKEIESIKSELSKSNKDRIDLNNKIFALFKEKSEFDLIVNNYQKKIVELENSILEKEKNISGLENNLHNINRKNYLETTRKKELINKIDDFLVKLNEIKYQN